MFYMIKAVTDFLYGIKRDSCYKKLDWKSANLQSTYTGYG